MLSKRARNSKRSAPGDGEVSKCQVRMEQLELAFSKLHTAWKSDERKWLVSFRDPLEIWQENPTFLMLEVVIYIWTLLLFRHARKHGGGRLHLLLVTSVLHGLVVESLSYVLPEIDNFWHGVSSVVLFKLRMPLHIFFFYPCFHYTTNVAVRRLRLPWWSEPFAVALADLLLDIPFDILGIKYLWWTWHDTDPNIFDRTYSVPLSSYIFHLTFASSFSFLLNGSRWLLTGSRDLVKFGGGPFTEFVCMMLTACLSMPMAALVQFIPLYHCLHDILSLHTEVCVWICIGLYVFLAWTGDRHGGIESRQAAGQRSRKWFDETSLSVLIHFLFYILLVFSANPSSFRSTGPHETIGNCSRTSYINTVTGMQLPKKTFLCVSNYTEPYFDFHCLPGGKSPPSGSTHYTVCGTGYDNMAEYQVIIVSSCLLGLAVFYQIFRSGKGSKVKKS